MRASEEMPCPRAIGLCVLSLVACAGAFPLSNVSLILPAEHEPSLTPAGLDQANEVTPSLDQANSGGAELYHTQGGLELYHPQEGAELYQGNSGDINATVVEDAEIYHAMLHVHEAAKRVFESIEDMWGVVLAEEQRKRQRGGHLSTPPPALGTPSPHLGGTHHSDADPARTHHHHADPAHHGGEPHSAAPTSSEGRTLSHAGASVARALQP